MKPATEYVSLVSKGIEFTPAGATEFKKGDPMVVYFEIYEPRIPDLNAPIKAQFHLKITRIDTGKRQFDSGPRDAMSYATPGNAVIAVSQNVAIDGLAPGDYRIEVRALDSAGETTAWRSEDFSVD